LFTVLEDRQTPAIAAGDPVLLGTTDQRGVMCTGAVDIGAYQS
jgi:hypothetical protein